MVGQARYIKVTKREYFDAALTRLAEHGPETLTIAWLCEQLGVTKGSFYHYFRSWAGFVEALLDHWEADQTHRIIELSRTTSTNAAGRLKAIQDQVVALPHEAEAAIRAWSRSDDTVRNAVLRVDERRHDELRRIIHDTGVNDQRAELLATMGMALLVGVQQLQRPVDLELLHRLLDELGQSVRIRSGRKG